LPEGQIRSGVQAVAAQFMPVLKRGGTILLDGYVGVLWESLCADLDEALAARGLEPVWLDVRGAMRAEAELDAMLEPYLPNDPLFGMRYPGELRDFFDAERLAALAECVGTPTIVFGSGAALLCGASAEMDVLLAYADVPKNEIQYRSRAGVIINLGKAEPEDPKAMYRRFYFVDWIVANRHKETLLGDLDLVIDAQRPHEPSCTSGDALRAGLAALACRPFRVRPWFEPGAWGGQWLKKKIPELPQDVPNYAWSFELIAPENGIVFEADGNLLEVSFDLLMFQEGKRVLGNHAARFGTEFPIRFDFLDTVEGSKLSLQCHPSPDYIRDRFGEPFTQDETYYLLNAEPCGEVYLGFQEGIDPEAFRSDVERSMREGTEVDVRHYVQTHPANRHDLFLIPHGTIHCSGKGNLVLEISATPYIFTFKIYDWLRLDLDGHPRQLNIERAFENLDFSRQGDIVPDTLISRPVEIAAGDGWKVIHLPTHDEHFYDVHRLEFDDMIEVETGGSCHVLSLVEGEHVTVEAGGEMQRYHYAETIVVPEAVGRYRLRSDDGSPLKVVKAFVK